MERLAKLVYNKNKIKYQLKSIMQNLIVSIALLSLFIILQLKDTPLIIFLFFVVLLSYLTISVVIKKPIDYAKKHINESLPINKSLYELQESLYKWRNSNECLNFKDQLKKGESFIEQIESEMIPYTSLITLLIENAERYEKSSGLPESLQIGLPKLTSAINNILQSEKDYDKKVIRDELSRIKKYFG